MATKLKKYPKRPKTKTPVSRMTAKQVEAFEDKIKAWKKTCAEIDRENNAKVTADKRLKASRESLKKKIASLVK